MNTEEQETCDTYTAITLAIRLDQVTARIERLGFISTKADRLANIIVYGDAQ
jgi:hypothetical protein